MSQLARVIFDCNTLLQALSSPEGPAGQCVQLALDAKIRVFVSPAILEELHAVCSRPKVIEKLHLESDRVAEFSEAIQVAATILADVPEVFAYSRDPDDAIYINLAVAAQQRS